LRGKSDPGGATIVDHQTTDENIITHLMGLTRSHMKNETVFLVLSL